MTAQAARPDVPRELFELYASAPRGDDMARARFWLGKSIRSAALSDAILAMLGQGDSPPYCESLMLACAMAQRMGWPMAEANAAFKAEWRQARTTAVLVVEAAEKAARRLIYEAAPGWLVIAAAEAAFHRVDVYPDRSTITALCRRLTPWGTRGRRRG